MYNKLSKINILTNWKKWEISLLFFEIIFILFITIVFSSNISDTKIKIFSVISITSGIIGTFLVIKKSKVNYIFGSLHVLFYGLISFFTEIYGLFFLNIFIFLPLEIYGFINWEKKKLINKKINSKYFTDLIILFSFISIILSIFLFFLKDKSPIFDSFITSFSILGTILMIGLYKEQWLIWIMINFLSMLLWFKILFITDDIYISISNLLMWLIYLFNSLIGYHYWFNKN